MRTAKTHIRNHGNPKLVLLHGDEVPLVDQKNVFKQMKAEPANEKIAEVHYQESDGTLQIARFGKPAAKPSEKPAAKKES